MTISQKTNDLNVKTKPRTGSNTDIPEKYLKMLHGIAPDTEEVRALNMMLFQKANTKEYLQAQGVRFKSTMRIGEKYYYTDLSGEWFNAEGKEVSFENLLKWLQADHQNSECFTTVSYRGRSIKLDEEQLNMWLCSVSNLINIQLQSAFEFNDDFHFAKAVDDDIIRALKGLPTLDRSFKLDQASA